MSKIIARKEEESILDAAYSSEKPEFTTVYGRRRVGKTYLISNTFHKEEVMFIFGAGIVY